MRSDLPNGALGFQDRRAVVHDAAQVGVGEGDAAEGILLQELAGRGHSRASEKEAWLGAEVGVSPTVQDDAGDIAASVEAAAREHLGELPADAAFVIAERC